ncbi:Uncharacterised protein [Vibrio cholerae]|nr:Uncharacterised protein [Vibrio cholerae]
MERNQRWPTSSPDLLPRAQSRTRGGTQKILSQPFCRNLFVVSARFDLSRCR